MIFAKSWTAGSVHRAVNAGSDPMTGSLGDCKMSMKNIRELSHTLVRLACRQILRQPSQPLSQQSLNRFTEAAPVLFIPRPRQRGLGYSTAPAPSSIFRCFHANQCSAGEREILASAIGYSSSFAHKKGPENYILHLREVLFGFSSPWLMKTKIGIAQILGNKKKLLALR